MFDFKKTAPLYRAVAGCLLLSVIGFAQTISGTLTGTVSDASGSVIPDATVVVKNEATGDVRKTVTNASGYFTVAAIPAGSYDVSLEKTGFQKYETSNLVFNGSDKRNLDIVLKVGTATQTVEVVSAQETVTTVDSGEKSSVLTTKELQNISVVGRSAAEFIKILPGMAQTGSGVDNRPGFSGEVIGINGNGDGGHQSALGYFSANGTPTNSMDITADGSHVSDPGCNCATPVNPNTDMIQEFKVMTSNFSAENSKGPVVLNSISKSGTTAFHGEGYFYARHNALNSNDWLSNAFGVAKPANKYFFPGGSNYVNNLLQNKNSYQWLRRVDYSISDNPKLFVRYNLQNELQQFRVSLWWRPQQQAQVPSPPLFAAHNQSQSVSASLVHVFS